MSREEEIIVVDQRRLPLMIDPIVVEDKRLNELDIAVFTCLIYSDSNDITDSLISATAKRFNTTNAVINKSLDRLADVGLIYDSEDE